MKNRRNIKIILQYDGTKLDGWQKQGNTENTIQGKLEAVLSRLYGEPVEVIGSGRTDAGVHALGQTANFHVPDTHTAAEVKAYLNEYLSKDIRVLEAVEMPERFHARLSAVGKTYEYRMEIGKVADVFRRKYVMRVEERLNISEMKRASEYLLGTHDFKSFCTNKRMKKSTVRTITKIDFAEKDGVLSISYTGNGFLYNMVRIMTGTLIEVGWGRKKPEDMDRIILAGDRGAAGFTAPAQGLFLVKVEYPKHQE